MIIARNPLEQFIVQFPELRTQEERLQYSQDTFFFAFLYLSVLTHLNRIGIPKLEQHGLGSEYSEAALLLLSLLMLSVFLLRSANVVVEYTRRFEHQVTAQLIEMISAHERLLRENDNALPALDIAVSSTLALVGVMHDGNRHPKLYDIAKVELVYRQVAELAQLAVAHFQLKTKFDTDPQQSTSLALQIRSVHDRVWMLTSQFYRQSDDDRLSTATLLASSWRSIDLHALREPSYPGLHSFGQTRLQASRLDRGPGLRALEQHDPLTIRALLTILDQYIHSISEIDTNLCILADPVELVGATLLRQQLSTGQTQRTTPIIPLRWNNMVVAGGNRVKGVRFGWSLDQEVLKKADSVLIFCTSPKEASDIEALVYETLLVSSCATVVVVAMQQGWLLKDAFPSAQLVGSVADNSDPVASIPDQSGGTNANYLGLSVYQLRASDILATPAFTEYAEGKVCVNPDLRAQLVARHTLLHDGQLTKVDGNFQVVGSDSHDMRIKFLMHAGMILLRQVPHKSGDWHTPLIDAIHACDINLEWPAPWLDPDFWQETGVSTLIQHWYTTKSTFT